MIGWGFISNIIFRVSCLTCIVSFSFESEVLWIKIMWKLLNIPCVISSGYVKLKSSNLVTKKLFIDAVIALEILYIIL